MQMSGAEQRRAWSEGNAGTKRKRSNSSNAIKPSKANQPSHSHKQNQNRQRANRAGIARQTNLVDRHRGAGDFELNGAKGSRFSRALGLRFLSVQQLSSISMFVAPRRTLPSRRPPHVISPSSSPCSAPSLRPRASAFARLQRPISSLPLIRLIIRLPFLARCARLRPLRRLDPARRLPPRVTKRPLPVPRRRLRASC